MTSVESGGSGGGRMGLLTREFIHKCLFCLRYGSPLLWTLYISNVFFHLQLVRCRNDGYCSKSLATVVDGKMSAGKVLSYTLQKYA